MFFFSVISFLVVYKSFLYIENFFVTTSEFYTFVLNCRLAVRNPKHTDPHFYLLMLCPKRLVLHRHKYLADVKNSTEYSTEYNILNELICRVDNLQMILWGMEIGKANRENWSIFTPCSQEMQYRNSPQDCSKPSPVFYPIHLPVELDAGRTLTFLFLTKSI